MCLNHNLCITSQLHNSITSYFFLKKIALHSILFWQCVVKITRNIEKQISSIGIKELTNPIEMTVGENTASCCL